MLPSDLPLDKKELHFLLQGTKALQKETKECSNKMLQHLTPADSNVQMIIEYYDKRQVELHKLEVKILGFIGA